jgi:hypothetical protein
MAWTTIPLPKLIHKADEAQLPDQIGARLVNGYIDEFGHIRKRPGLEEFVDLGTPAKIDGLFWWDLKGYLIAVSNGNVYKITSSFGSSTIVAGDELERNEKVNFTNGLDGSANDILIMGNGGKMVYYDGTNNTDFINDQSATAPTQTYSPTWLDGYVLADTSGRGVVAFCEVNDAFDWPAINIFSAETRADAIQYLEQRWREITIFGKETIDIFYNDGVSPFIRLDGAYSESGTSARHSVLNMEGTWLFLDDKHRISTLIGREVRPISTAFDDELRDLEVVDDSVAMGIDMGTRRYYVLKMPSAEKTYVYDMSVKQMAEWGKWNTDIGIYEKFVGHTHAYAKDWGLHLIGHESNGKIYKLSNDVYTDDGDTIRTLIRTGNINHGTTNKKRSNALRLLMKRGVGNSDVKSPEILIRWRDNGRHWKNWRAKQLGRSGHSDFFIDFKQMGSYRTRQYEIVHADATEFILTDIKEDIVDLGR